MFMLCLLKIIFAMYELSEKSCIMNFICHQLCRHNIYKIKAMQHMTEDMDMGFYDVKD